MESIAWIRVVDEADATGRQKAAYRQIAGPGGRVADGLGVDLES